MDRENKKIGIKKINRNRENKQIRKMKIKNKKIRMERKLERKNKNYKCKIHDELVMWNVAYESSLWVAYEKIRKIK